MCLGPVLSIVKLFVKYFCANSARVISRVLHVWYLKVNAFSLKVIFVNILVVGKSLFYCFFIEHPHQKIFSKSTPIFLFFLFVLSLVGLGLFVCLLVFIFFNPFPHFLPSPTPKDWPHASQFSVPPWLTLSPVGKTYFILLPFLFCCRFWLELFLALEQVYRLRAVCADFHWCDRLHHLPLAWLISLCGNAGLPCSVHRGYVRRSPALP